MKKSAIIQLVVEEYLSDTHGLTLGEHGAYFLSMLHYYRRQEALSDVDMRQICQIHYKRVVQFYVQENGFWHHKRIDIELMDAKKKVEMYRIKAAKMVAGRNGNAK